MMCLGAVTCLQYINLGWCQWPHGLNRGFATSRFLGLWDRIPPRTWMFVCCVLSDKGTCDELITCPEEFYRMWCIVLCVDLETSRMRRQWYALDYSGKEIKY